MQVSTERVRSGFRCMLPLVIILSMVVLQPLYTQQATRPQVGIAAFETTDDPRLQAAADSISSTIDLTLRLLDRYDVRQVPAWRFTGGAPPSSAQLRTLDFIVFGSVQDQAGNIVLDLSVYSRAANDITDQHQDSVSSVFDLFDASDEAAIALLESLSGEVIRFATLRLRNTGSPGEYAVYIDNVPVGENLNEVRVLVGSRSVRVTQERMLRSYTVFEGVENLAEGATRTVEFRIPLATAEERQTLVDLEQRILDDWENPERVAVVEQLFSRAFFLLDDISYSPGLSDYRDSFVELRNRYNEQLAEGFSEEDTPQSAIAEDDADETPAPPSGPGFVRPGPPTVAGAFGLKGGFGLGWWTGSDWLDSFDDHGPDWTAHVSAFGYYHLHRNLALQLQLTRQRHTTNSWYNDIDLVDGFEDFLFYFWTTDLALLLRPTARSNVFQAYLLLGPVVTVNTSDVTVKDYSDREELDTFELESDPFLGFMLGAGLGIRIARVEVFSELLYNRTSFEVGNDFEAISNSIMSVTGLAVQLQR